MKLSEEFNPYNAKHVRAWLHLVKTGEWPEEFWQWMENNNMERDIGWCQSIAFKMADAWCQQMMEEFDND
jgi:hypothetical protein